MCCCCCCCCCHRRRWVRVFLFSIYLYLFVCVGSSRIVCRYRKPTGFPQPETCHTTQSSRGILGATMLLLHHHHTHTHIYIYIGWVEEDCAFFFLVVCLLWLRGNKVETDKTRQSVSERTEPKASFASSTVYVCGKWKGVRGGGGGGSLVGSQAQEGEEEEEEEKWNRRRRTWIYPSHIYGSIDIRRQEENIDNRGGKEEKKRKEKTEQTRAEGKGRERASAV